MQALIIFALVGMLMAAVGGVVTMSVDTIQQFIANQETQTERFFESAETVLLNNVVQRRMEIPHETCPNGSSYTVTDVRAYLCRTEIAQLAEWPGSANGLLDPWKNAFTGYVVKEQVPIYAAPPNNVVTVPVTAMVLVSAGPDGQLNSDVQAALSSLSAGSEVRDVLNIGGPNPSTCDQAIDSCDDIVYTFSDQGAQERRWQSVQSAVDRIAAAALRHYENQFRLYLSQLEGIYDTNVGVLYDADGNVVIDQSSLAVWQGQGDNPASFATIDMDDADDRRRLGVDEEFRYLTETVANGGSSLELEFTVSNSTNGIEDVLIIDVSNNGSPWGQSAGGGGNLAYRKRVSALGE